MYYIVYCILCFIQINIYTYMCKYIHTCTCSVYHYSVTVFTVFPLHLACVSVLWPTPFATARCGRGRPDADRCIFTQRDVAAVSDISLSAVYQLWTQLQATERYVRRLGQGHIWCMTNRQDRCIRRIDVRWHNTHWYCLRAADGQGICLCCVYQLPCCLEGCTNLCVFNRGALAAVIYKHEIILPTVRTILWGQIPPWCMTMPYHTQPDSWWL